MIYNIVTILMALFNVDSNIASNLVNEMLKDNDIKLFFDIMYNEGTIFINSLILFYIACANKNAATRLITQFDINLIIEKIESDDDFVGLQTLLMTSNILLIKDNRVLMDITPTGYGKLVVILKKKNVLDNSHFIWSLALANKKIAHKLIKNKEYISYLINAIEKEGNLVEIGTLIIWVAYINKEIALNMIRAVDTEIFLEKIHHAEKIENINYFLMSLAYVDRRLAVEYYMFSVAYADKSLAFELAKEIGGVHPHFNIKKYLNKLFSELEAIFALSRFTEYLCLEQLRDKWTMKFN